MTSQIISPALRRAIMRAHPDYFRMPVDAQEKYRVNIPDDDNFIIMQQLIKDLFGLQINNQDDLERVRQDFNLSQQNNINEAILPVWGIGENYFWLNESFGGKNLLDFDTLYDYDYYDHAFQEKHRERDFDGYKAKPYRGSLYAAWARLFVDEDFIYASLYCAAGYIYGELQGAGSEILDALIPHKYVHGKDHGKKETGGFLHDMKIDAAGKEEQLDELRRRMWEYENNRYDELQNIWHEEALGQAYQIHVSQDGDENTYYIFSDKTALQAVRFRFFMTDFRKIEAEPTLLQERVRVEQKRLQNYLEEQLADIEENYDPKITKFRKKRKIIMSTQALDDLNDI
jgi:hypothetical protein